jgi:hypothetical protein
MWAENSPFLGFPLDFSADGLDRGDDGRATVAKIAKRARKAA